MTLEVSLSHGQGGFRAEMSFRAEGRLTCLFGRSGAGKTTLVNAIAGLLRPERGRIVAGGEVLLDTASRVFVPPHRRRIGYVFQEGRLFPHLSVRRNLLFGRWFARREGGPDLDSVAGMLGIGHLLDRSPATLSGGEKQRVAIGRALLARPRLLLMDEPLASLDDARKAEILPYVERLRDAGDVPIVYVSHAVPEVVRLADTVVTLDAGRVVATGKPGEVLSVPNPMVGERDVGSVLQGVVIARDDAFGLARVATEAGEVWLPSPHRAGERVRLFVPAREVMVATEHPRGISALNVLPAVVEATRETGDAVEVVLACGTARLVARLTRKSVSELGLGPGRPVHALIKSMSLDRS